jgi:hypothetical protein
MPLRIRVYADGRIERDTVSREFGRTVGCPLNESNKAVKVAPDDAQRVIAKARDSGFYGFANEYNASSVVLDAGTYSLLLSIHGQTKRVSNHVGNPPPLFGELIDTILKLSPMDEFIYPSKFSPERKAACEEFQRTGRLR